MRALALAALAILALCAAARPEIEGVWSFKTKTFDGGCVMTGQLIVGKADAKGVRACTIRAREECPRLKGDALERCTLTERGGRATIKSVVIQGPPNAAYYPDDFDLRIETESRMSGQLQSAGSSAGVLFFRGPGVIS